MGGKATAKRRQNNGIGSLMLSFITFILGYLVASAFDISSLSHWMSNRFSTQATPSHRPSQVQTAELPKPKFEFYTLLTKDKSVAPALATASTKPATVAVATQVAAKSESTINPSHVVAVVSSSLKTAAAPLDLTVTQKLPLHEPLVAAAQPQPQLKTVQVLDKGRYIIQVGSFKNQHEAEKMKAALVMRGFSPVITSATQQQVTWYRVLIGPFPSLNDAQRVHREFAVRDRITGMIRKLDV